MGDATADYNGIDLTFLGGGHVAPKLELYAGLDFAFEGLGVPGELRPRTSCLGSNTRSTTVSISSPSSAWRSTTTLDTIWAGGTRSISGERRAGGGGEARQDGRTLGKQPESFPLPAFPAFSSLFSDLPALYRG